jgi:Fe2+ or Zn2+ uptake regulation protein
MQKQELSGCGDPFIELCKKFDLKITPQRCAIYKKLSQAKDHHHHFHCIHCGEIVDFYSDEFDNLSISNFVQDDFVVYTKTVVLNGICQKCRQKGGLRSRNVAIKK